MQKFFPLIFILLLLPSLTMSIGPSVDEASQIISSETSGKADLLNMSPFDLNTTLLLIVWTVLMLVLKEKMQIVAILGGWFLILYAQGYLTGVMI